MAHYAKLAGSRYAFITTESNIVVMRVLSEESHSGMSDISGSSLDSFAPEDLIGIEADGSLGGRCEEAY
jgi:hypothetical protein